MSQGWIKVHRELMDKPIWLESTPEQKVILITLLTMANHQEKQWEWQGAKYEAKAGQFVTSLESIRKRCGKGISIKNIRTALKRFEKYDFLANESTNTNRLITIVNWGTYQGRNTEPAKEPADDWQRGGKEVATNKNVRMQEDYIYIDELPPKPDETKYEYLQRRVEYKLKNNKGDKNE